jgi:hypothetical protein
MACTVGVLLALGPFAASLLVRVARLGTLSTFDMRSDSGWTPATFTAALAQLGLSVGLFQLATILLDLVVALCFVLVAAVLLWRKSDEWLALVVALFLITWGTAWPTKQDELAALSPGWSWLFTLQIDLSFALLLAFCFLFPDGRFVPGWTRWLLVTFVAGMVSANFSPFLQGSGLSLVVFFSCLTSSLVAQIYRYRSHATPLQRQQIKWLVVGFGATLAGLLGFIVLGALVPALGPSGTTGLLFELAGYVEGNLLFLPIPLCVGIALLRYRLWGIDWIINKALVYGLLTALLAAVYAALIFGLQSLVGGSSGKHLSRWRSSSRPWRSPPCSYRCGGASRLASIGASIGASTMPSRPWPPLAPRCAMRWTWRSLAGSC